MGFWEAPYYSHSILSLKTLFKMLRPLHYPLQVKYWGSVSSEALNFCPLGFQRVLWGYTRLFLLIHKKLQVTQRTPVIWKLF